MEQVTLFGIYFFGYLLETASAHHEEIEPWRSMHYHYGIFKAFFSGFFSTMALILGVLVFYYYCMRGGNLGRMFPFPKRPIIPITIPFARGSNYNDPDRHETLVLTSATNTPSVFYSHAHATTRAATSPWQAPIATTAKISHPGIPPSYDII